MFLPRIKVLTAGFVVVTLATGRAGVLPIRAPAANETGSSRGAPKERVAVYSDRARRAVQALQADLNAPVPPGFASEFVLSLLYLDDAAAPWGTVYLTTTVWEMTKTPPHWAGMEPVTKAEAGRVIDHLAGEGFFDRATVLAPGELDRLAKPCYLLSVSSPKTGRHDLALGWDLRTFRRLKAFRGLVGKDAAGLLDRGVLGPLEPQRRLWERARALRKRLDAFSVEVRFEGDGKRRPLPSLLLSVPPAEGRKDGAGVVRLDRKQASRLIDHLASTRSPVRTHAVAGKGDPPRPGYAILVRPVEPGLERLDLPLGSGMLQALQGIRRALDGEAAEAVGRLVKAVWSQDEG